MNHESKAEAPDHEAVLAAFSRGAEDDIEVQEAVRVLRAKLPARVIPPAEKAESMDVDLVELERENANAKRLAQEADEKVQSAKKARTDKEVEFFGPSFRECA